MYVNGTQNLSLSISQTRQNCNYNITLLFVPFLPLRHWCSHHFLVRYMGHRYSLDSGGEGVRNQAGYRLPLRRFRERAEGGVPYVMPDSALWCFDFRVEPPYGQRYKKGLLCLQKAQYTSRCGLLCRR